MLIDQIKNPQDLKKLTRDELKTLANQIREFLIDSVFETGGHLSSNLGAIELTLAIHYVFDAPKDKIVWDVGHQTYTHKIITGRKNMMSSLRKKGGLSGFPNVQESIYDNFGTGHSSTSISAMQPASIMMISANLTRRISQDLSYLSASCPAVVEKRK